MRNSKIILGAYATVLMTLSASADAAGLGKLTVLSSLGEPLRAEIEVLDVADLDLSTLTARMASSEAFRQSGIDRATIVSSVRFAIEKKKKDGVVIKVSSPQIISDPFLDLLVEFQWPTGRLVREYTVLLDPPGYARPEAVVPVALPAIADKEAQKAAAVSEPTPLPPPEKAKPEPKAAPSRKAVAAEKPQGDKYGPVKKGQSLYQIAGEVKPAEVSLEEMLVALYRSNPNAFAGKNMNRLVTGKILNVPSAEEAGKISQPEAKKEIRAQVSDWKAYREKLAAAVEAAPAPAAKEEPAKQAAAGKITTKTEEKAAPKPSQDVLKLSKAEAGKGAAAKTGDDKLHAMQEDLLAKEKTLKEANERIAQLEKTVKDMQRLLEVKNQNLAAVQQQATPVKAEAPKPEQKEAPKAEAKPEEKKAEVPPAQKPAEAKPAEKPKPKPVVKPEPKPEPSLMDTVMGEPMYLGGLGALVLLLIGGALAAMRKIKEKRLAGFQTSMLSGGDLVAPAEKAGAAASDTSFLTDFSQAGLGTIDTNEVDPIAEAEVYMAYGRDGQAEEILKEAMVKDPHRYEIHLKLLEIYAGRKNLHAFETLATELYAALEGQHSPIWDKAAQMGHAIDPTNPLYGTAPVAPMEGEMEKTMVLTPAKMEALHEAAATEGAAASAALADLDFDLGAGAEQPQAEAAAAVDIDLGEPAAEEEMLDVSFPGEEAEALDLGEPTPAAEAAPVHAEEEAGLDFILEEPAVSVPEAAAPAAPPSDMEALDFDFESLTVAPPAEPAMAEHEAGMEDILEMAQQAEPAAEAVPAMEMAEEAALPEVDMGLEMPALETEAPAEAEAPLEMASSELEMPELEAPAAEETIEAAPAPAGEVDMAGLDFDFNLEEPVKAEAAEAAQPAVPELDLSGISLDLEEPAPAPVAESLPDIVVDESRWQEAATKLDLAKAYMEMGDREGAREILQEVLKEGNDQQKQDAQSMLVELS